jgi:hypothetical protein
MKPKIEEMDSTFCEVRIQSHKNALNEYPPFLIYFHSPHMQRPTKKSTNNPITAKTLA